MFTITEIEAFCARWYGGRPLLITPYAYTVTFSSLAAAATATQILSIQANADFIALSVSQFTYVSAAANFYGGGVSPAPAIRMLITDSGTNEQWTSAGVALDNYATNMQRKMFLPYPRILSGRSTQTIQLTNYSAEAETYYSDIVIEGVLVRAYSQQASALTPGQR